MLTMNPVNNTLYVAGGSPGGMRVAESNRTLLQESVFLYLGDALLFHFLSKKEGPLSVVNALQMALETINLHIDTNNLLFGVFRLTSEPLSNGFPGQLPIETVLSMVVDARVKSKSTHISGPRQKIEVKLTHTGGSIETFPSVGKAAKFLSAVAGKTVYKNTLLDAKNNKTLLHGYLVEY